MDTKCLACRAATNLPVLTPESVSRIAGNHAPLPQPGRVDQAVPMIASGSGARSGQRRHGQRFHGFADHHLLAVVYVDDGAVAIADAAGAHDGPRIVAGPLGLNPFSDLLDDVLANGRLRDSGKAWPWLLIGLTFVGVMLWILWTSTLDRDGPDPE